MKIKKIDHISIAVRNLEQARKVYEGILGLELASTYVAPREKIKVARYRVGDVWLELMEPTGEGEVSKQTCQYGCCFVGHQLMVLVKSQQSIII